MKDVHAADLARVQVARGEPFAGLPVIERRVHFIVAGRQGAEVNVASDGNEGARPDAHVALGDALAAAGVDDVQGQGLVGQQVVVLAAQTGEQSQRFIIQSEVGARHPDVSIEFISCGTLRAMRG